MEITCIRPDEIQRETRYLPAETYNLAKTLFLQSGQEALFIAIRSIQYLAIIDASEIVFVDGTQKNRMDVAWQQFHPNRRQSLHDPVPYDAVYYVEDGNLLMRRIQPAFGEALRLHAARHRQPASDRIAVFRR